MVNKRNKYEYKKNKQYKKWKLVRILLKFFED